MLWASFQWLVFDNPFPVTMVLIIDFLWATNWLNRFSLLTILDCSTCVITYLSFENFISQILIILSLRSMSMSIWTPLPGFSFDGTICQFFDIRDNPTKAKGRLNLGYMLEIPNAKPPQLLWMSDRYACDHFVVVRCCELKYKVFWGMILLLFLPKFYLCHF